MAKRIVARLMDVREYEKYSRGEEIVSYGKYFGKSSLNSMADIAKTPMVTFFDPEDDGSCFVVSRMFVPDSTEKQLIVQFEMEDNFVVGCAEGLYTELYVPSYSKETAVELWHSAPFIKDFSTPLDDALMHLRNGRDWTTEYCRRSVPVIAKEDAIRRTLRVIRSIAWPAEFSWWSFASKEERQHALSALKPLLKHLYESEQCFFDKDKLMDMLNRV